MVRREIHTGFWWGNLKERDHFEEQGVTQRIILEWILKKVGWEDMDWINLAQDGNKWFAVLNTVMKLQV
jgi:hypothetical protein